MADSVELRMSVTSIKRVDPYVKEILATATHVALYKFNTSTNEWAKTETEGALFVYSRNGEPYHSIMVMNRLNTNNVIEPIVKEFDYQMQIPFLLYRNSKSKIFGIWFFNREECVQITYLIESIMENIKDKSSGNARRQENGVDIFSLLSKAQEDFNKTPTKQDLGPSAFSTPRVADCTSKSVMDFFAKAGTKSTQKSGAEGENVLQRLMSNPAHTVEHIEKQQRSITPQEQVPPKQKTADRRSVPISFPSTSNSTATAERRDVPENGLNLMGMSPPYQTTQGASPLAFLMQGSNNNPPKQQPDDSAELLGTSPFAQFLENSSKPMLMTPMMFTASEKSENPPFRPENIDLLTEKQLAQALIHLLKTNSNFTRQIHEAYVNSIMEKVNLSTNTSLI